MNGHAGALAPDLQRTRAQEQRVALALLAAIATLALVVSLMLVFYFDPTGIQPPPTWHVAGPVDSFAPASIHYFREQHFYLVRFQDGSFSALYDVDFRVRSLGAGLDRCRLLVREGGSLGQAGDVPGFSQILRDPCYGSAYLVTGERIFGPSPFGLSWFAVEISPHGLVKVNWSNLRCPQGDWCDPVR